MRTIFKYPIEITNRQIITSPLCSEIRHVGLDPSGQPCMWAEADFDLPPDPWTLYIIGTGHPIPNEATRHIGSFVQGPFVWHAYI